MSERGPARVAIVVSGVPGAGKTSLGRALAAALDAPFLGLDAIKERLHHESGGVLGGLELRLAAEAELSTSLRDTVGLAVVDVWIQPGRDTSRVSDLLVTAGASVVEVLCRVPGELAVERYARRVRFGPHRPADEATLQRIRDAAAALVPLGLGPCVEVDTTSPVDVDPLAARLSALIESRSAGGAEVDGAPGVDAGVDVTTERGHLRESPTL